MLIVNAEIAPGRKGDLRISGETIAAIASRLNRQAGEVVVDADGGCVLPALHDHHIHLLALARARESVPCGPPDVSNPDALVAALRNAKPLDGWIRGVGYHPSVAGEIDQAWIDAALPERAHVPIRIQHRSGRLWIFNGAGLRAVQHDHASSLFETKDGRFTGRLYDGDRWLQGKLPAPSLNLHEISKLLARHGIASITDATPHNGAKEFEYFRAAQQRGELLQDVLMMGGLDLPRGGGSASLRTGAVKFHLHEGQLPQLDATVAQIVLARQQGRNVAFHAVTLGELAFVIAALRQAGSIAGDRIEHAAVVPDSFMDDLRALKLTVVTQPNFVLERGDVYREELPPAERAWLYRSAGFCDAGIPLAFGSDAPFGSENPWLALKAAVCRKTRSGQPLGEREKMDPAAALGCFLSSPEQPGRGFRTLAIGQPATLCLLDRAWEQAMLALDEVCVYLTMCRGKLLWES